MNMNDNIRELFLNIAQTSCRWNLNFDENSNISTLISHIPSHSLTFPHIPSTPATPRFISK